MKTMLTRCAVLLALASLGASAAAQDSILERRYTSDKLDRFWRETLGRTGPDATLFEALADQGDGREPVVEEPETFVPDVPFGGIIIGEDATAPAETVTRGFPVVPLTADEAATLYRRLAWAELYLGRYRYFERVSTDTEATLRALTERQRSAALELYLIQARIYFAAPDLNGKCAALRRLDDVAAGSLQELTEDGLQPRWRPLVGVYRATSGRLDDDGLRSLVCRVSPVRTRGEMQSIVTTRVREQTMAEVEAKVRETLTLLEAAAESFQALVNSMDVEIRSAEILELERVLGNVQANLMLVKDDQLEAESTIDEVEAVDLSQLSQPTELAEYQQAETSMGRMVEEIDAVLSAVANLASVSDEPDLVAELAGCDGLRGLYPGLDLDRDTGRLTAEVMEPYVDCLDRARQVVARFQQPSLDKAFMAELAARVRQISEAFLTSGN